ncbi:penicillin-binding protein activator [Hydrocarboniclastica marina]|uniref:LppC family lipoprotein n=1 Tax=Hydrocarboniclastica marina TaxID=2259620 RepID=A0A4P7XH62_9ALTE|nr:penicillin-binding protein activator [Hydrocarboniclastica marina]QCF25127.1 LppC family lipoprotein [Hydrocarboniclastica marina]
MPRLPRFAPKSIAALLVLLLAGCGALSTDPATQTEAPRPDQLVEDARRAENAQERSRLLLKAADAYQIRGDHETARQLLLQLGSVPQLEKANQDQWFLLSMRGIVDTANKRWARHLVQSLPVTQFSDYPDLELQRRAAELQAEVFALADQPLEEAQTLIYAAPLLEDAHEHRNRIWRSLASAPLKDIEALSQRAEDFDLQGWLELTLALRGPALSLEDQSGLIRQWQARWRAHPAASQLPDELELLAALPDQRPASVALALPLSGPLANAGKAVREGFLAAYYQDESQQATSVELIDTHDRDFSSVYAELLERNPDLVVGPLRKSDLASLDQSQRLPVPVLALNYLESQADAPAPAENLYQFGLSPDDEAREIAQRLNEKGYANVALFAPGTDWGLRLSEKFQDEHSRLGGRVIAEQHFQAQQSLREVVATAFGINESRNRAIRVEETIGMDVEFEPRRRQDIDAVVLLADPARARQLKPMFAFYYGGSLPVFGSSVIYEGSPDPVRDADLENIQFTDLPWILERPVLPLRSSLQKTFPSLAGQYDRLFALGADAYLLSSRLPLLEGIPDSTLEGYTGLLTMTENREVRRQQGWAVFERGAPRQFENELPAQSEQL